MNAPGTQRYPLVDALRGLAICGVVLYHLLWDLWYFDIVVGDWIFGPVANVIVRTGGSLFLFVVGVSLVLAHPAGVRWRVLLRRVRLIAALAFGISIVTWLLFRDDFVYFGILHSIALASLLGALAIALRPEWLLAVAFALVVTPLVYESPLLDPRWLAWTGLAADSPASYDFWPLLPWTAATFVGIASARLTVGANARWIERNGPMIATLAKVGRHSLAIYLLHQPFLFATIAGLREAYRTLGF